MESESNTRSGLTMTLFATGALLTAAYLVFRLVSQANVKKDRDQVEKARDKTLKDSFPASDPPASQFFDIPVNRH